MLGGRQCKETGGGAYINVGGLRGRGLNGSQSNKQSMLVQGANKRGYSREQAATLLRRQKAQAAALAACAKLGALCCRPRSAERSLAAWPQHCTCHTICRQQPTRQLAQLHSWPCRRRRPGARPSPSLPAASSSGALWLPAT